MLAIVDAGTFYSCSTIYIECQWSAMNTHTHLEPLNGVKKHAIRDV